jgi:hypothetical protein
VLLPRIAFLLALLLVAACAPRLEGQAEILYVGFNLEILLPITPDNIAEMNSTYGKVEVSDPRLQEVIALLDAARPGSFYAGTTRVRIRDSHGETVYIDSGGGVRGSTYERQLNDAALRRVAYLLNELTFPHVSAANYWPVEAAHLHIAEHEGWSRSDYFIVSAIITPKWDGPTIIVKVRHNEDITLFEPKDGVLTAGGGKSFEIHYNAETREFLRELRYQ